MENGRLHIEIHHGEGYGPTVSCAATSRQDLADMATKQGWEWTIVLADAELCDHEGPCRDPRSAWTGQPYYSVPESELTESQRFFREFDRGSRADRRARRGRYGEASNG